MNAVDHSATDHLVSKAGWLMAASGLMFLLSLPVSGFSQHASHLSAPGILSIAMAWGLLKDIRWVAYPAFLIALFGGLYAYANMGGQVTSGWWLGIIAMVQLVVATFLFIHIWQR